MKSGIVEPVNMSGNDGGSLFARSGIFGALNTDLSAGDLSENQYEWHRGASAFNPYGIGVTVGGGGMQSGEFGSIADPVPNLVRKMLREQSVQEDQNVNLSYVICDMM